MKKIVTVLILVFALAGCVTPGHEQSMKYLLPGSYAKQVGVVTVYKTLKYSGKPVEVQLAVKVDENGNTILVAGEKSPEEISVYLSEAARQGLVANMTRMRKYAVSSNQESMEPFEFVGSDIDNRKSPVFGKISLDYSRYEFGEYLICNMKLSGYDLCTAATPQLGTPFGRKEVELILPRAAVEKLLKLIEPAPDLTSIAFDNSDRITL